MGFGFWVLGFGFWCLIPRQPGVVDRDADVAAALKSGIQDLRVEGFKGLRV